jgi:hypothetical protein
MLCEIDGCGGKRQKLTFCQKHYQRIKKYGSPDDRKWSQAPLEVRFWLKVDKKSENECWPWLGQKLKNGYGRLSLGPKSEGSDGAHRVSWMLANKQKISAGMFVMHKCDNPECVNPSHLAIGTPKENTADMIAKGRKRIFSPVGNKNGKAIITPDIVRQIRASDESHASLARRFNISPNCVRGVRIGRTWSHVE